MKLSMFKTHTNYDKHIVIKAVDKHSVEQMYMYINGSMLLAVNTCSYLKLMINIDWSKNAVSTYCVMFVFFILYWFTIQVLLIASACTCYKL